MKITKFATGPLAVNTYLVIDESTKKGFIVDPGGHSPKLTEQVASEKVDIAAIILTHGHGDHIGGVPAHKKDFPDAIVIAHEAELPLLADAGKNISTMVFGFPITINPDKTVKEGDTMQIGTIKLRFFHTPGHSPGGMCFLAEDVLFSGDTLFHQSIGRTDFPGSSFQELMDAIHQKLFTLPDKTEVLPGHMGSTSIGYEKENNPFV